MNCPICGHYDTRVYDSRVNNRNMVRRRRECVECRYRFVTYETIPVDLKKNDPKKRYYRRHIVKPLILGQEDWSEEEWPVILKLFGMEVAERIILRDYHFEAYGIQKAGVDYDDEEGEY